MNVTFCWTTLVVVALSSISSLAHAQTYPLNSFQNPATNQRRNSDYFAPAAKASWASYKYDQPDQSSPSGPAQGPPYSTPAGPMGSLPSSDAYSLTNISCGSATCGPVLCAPCDSRCGWFASAGGLVMSRDDENFLPFSYATGNEAVQLVTNRDADFSAAGGVEARLGRYFCCGQSSLEFVFWAVIPGSQSYQLLGSDVVGDLNGIYNWDQLDYNGGTADAFVNNAMVHRIQRDFEFQNYEINWNTYLLPPGCGALQVQTIAGFRVFRFGETIDFGADTADTVFTGAADEIHYNINVDNRLYGFQLGTRNEYRFSQRWSFTARILAGIFANDVYHQSRIGGAAGDAVVNNGPNNGQAFNVSGSGTNLSLLGELDFGLMFRPTCNWQISGGYRAMGVSGLALASNQLYHDLRGVNDVQDIEVNGDLILHGGYFQLSYNY